MSKRNIQKEVAEKLMELIKNKGSLAFTFPWVKERGESAFPVNYTNGNEYSGINVFTLWFKMQDAGYKYNRWLTLNQLKKLGGKVSEGEFYDRSLCIRYGQYIKTKTDKTTGEETEELVIYSKGFPLFNIEQVEGIELPEDIKRFEVEDADCVERVNALLDTYAKNTGMVVSNSGSRAFYSPMDDRLNIPNSKFKSPELYTATIAHELIHSTGHYSRLDRFEEQIKDFLNPDLRYAFEELVADMGAAFLCAHLGVDNTIENHASYLSGWLTKFNDDYRFITSAASEASKAFKLVINGGILEKEPEKSEQSEQPKKVA